MKIIRTANYKKIAEMMDGSHDPSKVNWTEDQEKVKKWTDKQLFFALKEAIEVAGYGANAGKYMDQASIYRRELENRGYSINKQDEILLSTPTNHFSSANYKKALNKSPGMPNPLTYETELRVNGTNDIIPVSVSYYSYNASRGDRETPPEEATIEIDDIKDRNTGKSIPISIIKENNWEREIENEILSQDTLGPDPYDTYRDDQIDGLASSKKEVKVAEDIPFPEPPSLNQKDYNKEIDERLMSTDEDGFRATQEEHLAREIYNFMIEVIDDFQVDSIREAELEAQLNFIDADIHEDYEMSLTSKAIEKATEQVRKDRKDFPEVSLEDEEGDRAAWEAETQEHKIYPDAYHVEDTSL